MTTWALDLDGVLWTGREPIVGSAEAVATLRKRGAEVVFVTNNSFVTVAEQEAKLASFGIDGSGAVISSAMAGAALVEEGERVFVLGGPGVREAVDARGATVMDVPEPGMADADVVVVGLDWDLSYHRLRAAVQAISAGARFVATNTDSTYPTENGFFPGAGAIVAAVSAATGQAPQIAGKPEEPIAELVRARYGSNGIMIGDRPETDGAFARVVGYRFGLVLSGVTQAEDLPTDPEPDVVADNLQSMVALVE